MALSRTLTAFIAARTAEQDAFDNLIADLNALTKTAAPAVQQVVKVAAPKPKAKAKKHTSKSKSTDWPKTAVIGQEFTYSRCGGKYKATPKKFLYTVTAVDANGKILSTTKVAA